MRRSVRVRLIARTELRRRWRGMKDNPAQLLALAVAALFVFPMALVGVGGAYVAGGMVASGEVDTPLELARLVCVYAWIFVTGFGGYRAYAVSLDPDNIDGLLTTISHRDLIAGIVLTEFALWTTLGLTVAGGAAVTFGIGAGSPLSILSVLLALTLILTTGLVGGFVLALGIRNLGVRSILLTRLRTLFVAVLAAAYFWVIVTNSFASVFDPLYHVLAITPVAWLGDLAAVALGVDASPFRAVGAVLVAVGFLAVTVPALSRLAEWLWYADGVHVTHDVEQTTESSRLAGLLPAPVLGVVSSDWARARRSPLSLSFALYPLFLLIDPIIGVVQTGTVGRGLPLMTVLCGTWITGSLFALNVLGYEGAALPVTLLSPDPARSLVTGHVLAGVLLLTPVTVVTTALTGLLSPHSIGVTASLTAAALLLTVGASVIATGIGAMLPRFEAVRVSRSTKAVVPSVLAIVVYSVVMLVVMLPAILGHSALFGHALTSLLDVDQLGVAVAGTVSSGVLAAGVGIVSMHFALNHVDDYRIS
jgi:hypothetical protein